MSWESYTAKGALKSGTVQTLGWEIIERKTPTGAAESIFQLDNTKYSSFQIMVKGIKSSITPDGVRGNFSTDGGSTWLTAYKRAGYTTLSQAGGVSSTDATGETNIVLAHRNIDNNVHDTFTAIITIGDTSAGLRTMVSIDSGFGGDVSSQVVKEAIVIRLNANSPGEVNAFRIYMNNGTMTGELTLLGLPKVITTPVVHKPNGWEVIEQRTHSGLIDMEFSDFAGFGMLQLVGQDIQCTTSNVDFQVQASIDGGSSFITTSSYNQGGYFQRFAQAVTAIGATVGTGFRTTGQGTQSGYLANSDRGGFLDIRLGQFAERMSFTCWGKYPDNNSGEICTVNMSGHMNGGAGVVNAFRVRPNLGTFSGKFTLLGLADF